MWSPAEADRSTGSQVYPVVVTWGLDSCGVPDHEETTRLGPGQGGQRPDDVEAEQAREAIRSRLFPTQARELVIGRYRVDRRLGAGGMGVVFAAHDPELQREVALKLLHPEPGEEGRNATRLLREARAMAKLAHPNVVAVFDVGEHGDRVFVAMELVAGRSLDLWLTDRERDWPEVLDVFVQAARGLAAAHRAGLVHRDFKPENVLMGEDGRVRVGDFGLAREHDEELEITAEVLDVRNHAVTRTGAIVGTPAYMSPEQFDGGPIDARSDQFSFCVALWEALFGRRPFAGRNLRALQRSVSEGEVRAPPPTNVPPRVLAALRRGLSVDPDERFPDMDALAAELAPPSRRPLIGWAIGGLGLVAAGVAVAVAVATATPTAEPELPRCTGAAEALAPTWSTSPNDERRQAVETALAAVPEQARAQGLAALDAYGQRWIDAHRGSCEATQVRGQQSSERMDQQMSCLAGRRRALEGLVRGLEGGDPLLGRRTSELVSRLPPPERCLDGTLDQLEAPRPEQASRVEEIQDALVEAHRLEVLGDYEAAEASARPLLEDAMAVGYVPLQAEVGLLLGKMRQKAGDFAGSAKALEEAHFAARTSHHREVAASTAAQLIYTTGFGLEDPDAARTWSRHAEVELETIGWGGLEEMDLRTTRGNVGAMMGDSKDAIEDLERARDLARDLLGPDHPRTAMAWNNLGRAHAIAGDIETARAKMEQAKLTFERGAPEHPELALTLVNLANAMDMLGEEEASLPIYEQAIELLMETRGPDHLLTAAALHNLGTVYNDGRDSEQAYELFRRSLVAQERILGAEHGDLVPTLTAMADAAVNTGRNEEAVALAGRALTILGDRDQMVQDRGSALMSRGRARLALDQRDDGLGDLRAAVEVYGTHESQPNLEHLARDRLGRALYGGGDHRAGRAEVRTARDGYAELGLRFGPRVEEMDAWLASHP